MIKVYKSPREYVFDRRNPSFVYSSGCHQSIMKRIFGMAYTIEGHDGYIDIEFILAQSS